MQTWFPSRQAVRLLCALLVATGPVSAQEIFSPFVATEPSNVERMIKLARLRDGDVVLDLGSGDGRVVIAAARANPKVRGFGVDVDAKLVTESNAAAREHGVADRVRFLRGNAFDADLRNANVITMWFWPETQRLLRTKILAQARPGTRIVTNLWDMGSWPADELDDDGPLVRLWVVPARVEGYWHWVLPIYGTHRTYSAVLEQRFQTVEGVVRVGNRRALLGGVRLLGEDISFTLAMTVHGFGSVSHEFSGKVRGDRIVGKARMLMASKTQEGRYDMLDLPWRAARTPSSAYFAPTGAESR